MVRNAAGIHLLPWAPSSSQAPEYRTAWSCSPLLSQMLGDSSSINHGLFWEAGLGCLLAAWLFWFRCWQEQQLPGEMFRNAWIVSTGTAREVGPHGLRQEGGMTGSCLPCVPITRMHPLGWILSFFWLNFTAAVFEMSS